MNKKSLPYVYLAFFSVLWLFLLPPAFCQDSPNPADAVVKITRVDQILEIMDQTGRSMSGEGQPSPAALVRSMLLGTDWIDPERAIVIGATFNPAGTQAADYAALVPFRRPNEDFQANYNATAGSNYYIVSLPPQKGGVVSDRMEEALAAASLSPPEALVSLDVAASRLIERAEPQIKKQLDAIEQQIAQSPQAEMDPEETRQMFESLIKTGREVRNISLGMDLSDRDFTFLFNVDALAESQLAKVFHAAGQEKDVRLADYGSTAPIHFRSHPYDVNQVMSFLDTHFGAFYKQMGIDFKELKNIMQYFSGEAAGGVAFTPEGMDIEVIAALDESKELPDNYLESVYLPWLMDYGEAMADYLNEQAAKSQTELEFDNLFQPMADSEVAGRKVVGVRLDMDAAIPDAQKQGGQQMRFEMAFRMTRIDSMILMASDDSRLGRLIEKAEKLKPQKATGPFMQMHMDLDAYLNAVTQMMPEAAGAEAAEVPSMGALEYTMEMGDGKLESRYTLAVEDIKKMAGYFQSLAGQAGARQERKRAARAESGNGRKAPAKSRPDSRAKPAPQKRKKPGQADRPDKDNPRYWLDKGQLYATYGNSKRAIEHFKKALEMEPENSAAFFNLGVSYGETGRYSQAMEAINRAILLEPENGEYYYARGWVRLLAGKKGQAESDMKRAAELGSADAKAWLKSINAR